MTYDSQNIFARILRGEIPCKLAYEDDFVLSFHDIHPKAPIHILILPKGAYRSAQDFYAKGSAEEIHGFHQAIPMIAEKFGVHETGYRLVANCGLNGGQEVPHFHMHLLGGAKLTGF